MLSQAAQRRLADVGLKLAEHPQGQMAASVNRAPPPCASGLSFGQRFAGRLVDGLDQFPGPAIRHAKLTGGRADALRAIDFGQQFGPAGTKNRLSLAGDPARTPTLHDWSQPWPFGVMLDGPEKGEKFSESGS